MNKIYLPKEISAVKVCLVPRFDSNKKPGRSSFKMVACCPSVLTIASWLSWRQLKVQLPTIKVSEAIAVNIGWLTADAGTEALALCSLSRNSVRLSLELEPPSGLPLEYIVRSFPSRTKRNHPLLPLDNSMAQKSLHRYKQSLPRTIHQSCQW